MGYATTDDLQSFVGAGVALPADAARLLERASEDVTAAMLDNYDSTDDDHVTAAKNATCAQVELWLNTGEAHSILGRDGHTVNLGGANATYKVPALAPRARRLLLTAGLLYRGVSAT